MRLNSLFGHADELIRIIRKSQQPADIIASDFFRNKKYIGSTERRFLSGVVFHALRTLSLCEQVQQMYKLESFSHAALAIALAGITPLTWDISTVAFTRDEQQVYTDLVQLAEQLKQHPFRDEELACIPSWVLDDVAPRWDKQTALNVFKAMCAPAPLCLRVNLRHTTREKVLAQLQHENIQAVAGEHSPAAIIIHQRVALQQHALVLGGFVEIQDEGSQLIALACNAEPWMVVLDACAGAGGKTMHLADIMNDKGLIIAQDIEWNRLKEIEPRARRAGVENISIRHIQLKTKEGAAQRVAQKQSRTLPRWSPGNHQPEYHVSYENAHVVLVDAPCSGMGTVRRLPMAKWRLTPELVQRHAQKQRGILNAYSERVLDGGALVYATCSVLYSENEAIVNEFLSTHPEFTLEAQQQADPYTMGTDGLYWARMRKK